MPTETVDQPLRDEETPRSAVRRRLASVTAVCFLACLVVAVFHPIVRFQFVNLDVDDQVVHNPHIKGLTWENVKYIFTSRCITSYYPVRTLPYVFDHELWGLRAGGFKLTNGLAHLTNVLLVFALLVRLLQPASSSDAEAKSWLHLFVAAIAAGLFAVHPLVVEPVAWVPGREELLTMLGALACFHCHLTARRLEERQKHRAKVITAHVLAAVFCLGACLSNAVGAVIPLIVTAWGVIMLPSPRARRIAWGTIALWAIAATTFVLKRWGQTAEELGNEFPVFSLDRLAVVLKVYGLNLRSIFWPTDLAVDYWNVVPNGLWDLQLILGGAALCLTCLLGWMLRRQQLALFGLLWFALALAPTAQIMPHHLDRADRFLYLPLVGLSIMLAAVLRPMSKRLAWFAGTCIASVLCLSVLLTLSVRQVQTWRNAITLWEHSLRVFPNSAFAHQCLGDALAVDGQFKRAIPIYDRAMRLDPEDARTLNNYAWELATFRDKALRDYDRAIRLATQGCELVQWEDPKIRRTLAMAHMNYGTQLKREGEFERAIQHYRSAIDADPNYEVPWFNLALLLATCSDAELRRPDEAVHLAEQACALVKQPDVIQLKILADVYAETGRVDEAITAIELAIGLALAQGEQAWADELGSQVKRLKGRKNGP